MKSFVAVSTMIPIALHIHTFAHEIPTQPYSQTIHSTSIVNRTTTNNNKTPKLQASPKQTSDSTPIRIASNILFQNFIQCFIHFELRSTDETKNLPRKIDSIDGISIECTFVGLFIGFLEIRSCFHYRRREICHMNNHCISVSGIKREKLICLQNKTTTTKNDNIFSI